MLLLLTNIEPLTRILCIDYICVHVTLLPASNKHHTSRIDEINSLSASRELFSVDVNAIVA